MNKYEWRPIAECPRDAKFRAFYSETKGHVITANWPVGYGIGTWKRNRRYTATSKFAYDGSSSPEFKATHFCELPVFLKKATK